jgi:hypothetical protein
MVSASRLVLRHVGGFVMGLLRPYRPLDCSANSDRSAWCFELFQNNFKAANVHLQATLRMIREHDKYSQVGIPRSVVSTASLAKGLMTVVRSRGQGPAHIEVEEIDHLYAPWIGPKYSTIDEARDAICGYIDNIVLGHGNLESCECTSLTF